MEQVQVYTCNDGQCILTAISKPNELEKQQTLKEGLCNVVEVTVIGK